MAKVSPTNYTLVAEMLQSCEIKIRNDIHDNVLLLTFQELLLAKVIHTFRNQSVIELQGKVNYTLITNLSYFKFT